MAGETTTAGKNKDKTAETATKKSEETKDTRGQDVAGVAPTREEILALHRKAAATKEVVTSDVVGYWNSDETGLPITGIPETGVVAIDSSLDSRKASLLMKWKVTLPTLIADADGNETICKAGDLVGIWFKPGMRDVRERGGIEVTMSRDPKKDKDMGKGKNKMKGYAIYANGMGQPLRLTEDRREDSKNAETVFDVKQPAPSSDRAPRNAPPLYEDGDRLAF